MAALPREQLEDFVQRWLEVNREAERNGDWTPLADFYAEDFPDPESLDPSRYDKPREEDVLHRWTWIPFVGRRHRCVGAAFGTMQIKAIFSVLLREYEFEMSQPSESYRNDHSKMVVQLARPAKVRYRKRGVSG